MLTLYTRVWDLERDVQRKNVFFSSLSHTNYVRDTYSNLHKEFEVFTPFVQLLTHDDKKLEEGQRLKN